MGDSLPRKIIPSPDSVRLPLEFYLLLLEGPFLHVLVVDMGDRPARVLFRVITLVGGFSSIHQILENLTLILILVRSRKSQPLYSLDLKLFGDCTHSRIIFLLPQYK